MKNNEIFENLRQVAFKGGAKDAKIISTKDVIIDQRVRLKCMIPPCSQSGLCRHCPPHGYSVEETQHIIEKYNSGILFSVEVENTIIAGKKVGEAHRSHKLDDQGELAILGAYFLLVFQIAALIKKKAKEEGLKAQSFAASNCKEVICYFYDDCRVLAHKKKCRHPDLSMPSMESTGMDVFKMAANAGWPIYPIGEQSQYSDIPNGLLCGLVLLP
ncbi:metal-binding protein-like protein [Candidatus Magnetomorum sp. HK-1]|nr:metal-binding protein-like protein [Candidatus Magnetomorum sp. HK-1]